MLPNYRTAHRVPINKEDNMARPRKTPEVHVDSGAVVRRRRRSTRRANRTRPESLAADQFLDVIVQRVLQTLALRIK